MTATHPLATRLALRRQARQLLRHPSDSDLHLARLQTALELPGAEPVQGALADLFSCYGTNDSALKRTALHRVRARLSEHAARWFESQTGQAKLPAITPLATRWSVLAHPSADVSTRARRCSPDDSHLLAERVVLAVQRADLSAQNEFLHHCITCHDKLAFMLARRALLRTAAALPSDWEAVSLQLEEAKELA